MAANNIPERSQISEHMKYARIPFTMQAIWPIDLGGFKLKMYNIIFWVQVSLFSLFVCLQGTEVLRNFTKDIVGSSIVLGHVTLIGLSAFNAIICHSEKVRRYIREISNIEETLRIINDDRFNKIHEKYVIFAKYSSFIIIFCTNATIGSYIIIPIINTQIKLSRSNGEPVEKEFLTQLWLPFDQQEYFWSTTGVQTLYAVITAGYYGSTNVFIVSILSFVNGHVKILQSKFRYFFDFSNTIAKNRGISLEEANIHYLNQCIKEHQKLCELVEGLRVTFQIVILFSFLSSSFQISIIGIQVIFLTDFNWSLIPLIFHFLSIVSVLYCTYFAADEIITESSKLSDAVYESEWFDLDLSLQKTLLQIMMRSQKSLCMSVGPFSKLELRLLLNITKTVYSIFCVMLNKF